MINDQNGTDPSNRVPVKDMNGKYTWKYEVKMMRNNPILKTIVSVLLISSTAPAFIVFISTLGDTGIIAAFFGFIMVFLVCAFIIIVLSGFAYILLSILYGGKYKVIFEMDEFGINHIQDEKQNKKFRKSVLLGIAESEACENIGASGPVILAASRRSMYSCFENVRKVTVSKKENTIYLKEILNQNQIYVDDEKFDFVADFIISRCLRAKIKYK